MKRLFFAIDIPPGPELLEAFDHIRNSLRMEKISWVNPQRMHLTLVFLGDTEESLVPSITTAAEAAIRPFGKFAIRLSSLGVFKNIHDPRVIWTGVEAGKELAEIKTSLDHVLTPFGVEPENRPYRPHLTLGRINFMRQSNHLSQLIGQYQKTIFQTDNIKEIVLYESILRPEGPDYRVIRKIVLQ